MSKIFPIGKKEEKTEKVAMAKAKKDALVAKAKELIPDEGIEFSKLCDYVEHWCIWGSVPENGKIAGKHTVVPDHESWHPTSEELKEIVMQVQEDNKPEPEVVDPLLGLPS